MARKSVSGNSKNSGKHSRTKSGAGTGTGSREKDGSKGAGPSVSESTNPNSTRNTITNGTDATSTSTANATSQSTSQNRPGLPLIFRFLLILYPILQMLWTVEAPLRPFSAVRDPTTRQYVTVEGLNTGDGSGGGVGEGGRSKALIEPRILVVVPHTRDLGFFMPTIGILEGTERKERCWVGVVGLSSGNGAKEGGGGGGEREKEWQDALEVFGSGLSLGVLDLPELRDDPSSIWDPTVIQDAILPFILEYNADTILTFDEKGITGNQHHTAVSQGITSLVRSQKLKDALASSSSSPSKDAGKHPKVQPRAYLLHTPTSPLLNPGLGPLSPLVQHIILVYRALRSSKAESDLSSESAGSDPTNALALIQRTTFISDIRTYWKSWKALVGLSEELYLGRIVGWMVGRSLWVNEWIEVF